MSSSSIFWELFMATGQIGSYLLYKYCEDGASQAEDDGDLPEVASQRG